MEDKPPAGFVSLKDAKNRLEEDINIMGVVTDFMVPSQSRGTDIQATFTLVDGTTEGGFYDPGLKVKYFRPNVAELPSIRGTGDVVILRTIKVGDSCGEVLSKQHTLDPGSNCGETDSAQMKPWGGATIALSGRLTECTVIHASSIPEKLTDNKTQLQHISSAKFRAVPSQNEQLYAIALCNAQDRSAFSEPLPDVTRSEQDSTSATNAVPAIEVLPVQDKKFSLIKDVTDLRFYDLLVQIIKIFPASGVRLEMYVTDYSPNDALFNYEMNYGKDNESGPVFRDGDTFGYATTKRKGSSKAWAGPYGKMTLQVTLWPPHCHFAQDNVKEGDMVLLRNVRVVYSKDGSSRLEANLHEDMRWHSRIDISVITEHEDDRVKRLLERKRAYWKKARREIKAFEKVAKSLPKRQSQDEVESRTLDKREGKKHKPEERRSKKSEPLKAQAQARTSYDLNKYVQSSNIAYRPTPLSDVIAGGARDMKTENGIDYRLPFQNQCCRVAVRVVDFFPHDIADFAVSRRCGEYDALSASESDASSSDSTSADSGSSCCSEDETSRKWEWRFYLLVEDGHSRDSGSKDEGKARLKVLVADRDAEFLLQMKAVNLRKDPTTLAQLREQLFVLWGDLEERKSSHPTKVLQQRDPNQGSRQRSPTKSIVDQDSDLEGDSGGNIASSGRPFECCLKEYGVRSHEMEDLESVIESGLQMGWKRMFRMFGTTIM
ncbi:MAG: hypothetical protein M1833_007331 [Piccolia ochrophora]|nr:MAG: hypothetical protein M1833_007331 [Piccolia ochrophora]